MGRRSEERFYDLYTTQLRLSQDTVTKGQNCQDLWGKKKDYADRTVLHPSANMVGKVLLLSSTLLKSNMVFYIRILWTLVRQKSFKSAIPNRILL